MIISFQFRSYIQKKNGAICNHSNKMVRMENSSLKLRYPIGQLQLLLSIPKTIFLKNI
jgi:hypothetical protein